MKILKYSENMKLYKSQQAYVNSVLEGSKVFMHAQMGTGKTLMSLWIAKHLEQNKVLVITKATVRDSGSWQQDAGKLEANFEDLRVESHAWLQKIPKKKRLLDEVKNYYVIIDEAHNVADSQSLQGKGAYMLCSTAKNYLLLSATPYANWENAVNFAKITGLVQNKTEFYKRFLITRQAYSHRGLEVCGYKNTDVLEKWWASISDFLPFSEVKKDKEEAEKLKKRFFAKEFTLDKTEEAEYYRRIKERITSDGDVLDNAPKLLWSLRALTEVSASKQAFVLNFLKKEEYQSSNVLIFVNSLSTIAVLSELFKQHQVDYGVFCGKKKDNFDNHRVMVVQYQSGGTGLNLQRFNITLFMSPCYSYIQFTQAIGRTYRNKQEKTCYFCVLLNKKTVDIDIYNVLIKRKTFTNQLIKAYVNKLTKTEK